MDSNYFNVGSVGSPVTVSNIGAIVIGQLRATYNTMTVTNANLYNSGAVGIGDNGIGNTVTVLSNAVWNNGGDITLGAQKTGVGNSLTVNGGMISGANLDLRGASGTSVTVSNGGQLIVNGSFFMMQGGGYNGILNVGGYGASSFVSVNNLQVGRNGTSSNNVVTVTNATLQTITGFYDGWGGSSNTVTILTNGVVNFSGALMAVGTPGNSFGSPTGNVLIINGGIASNFNNGSIGYGSSGYLASGNSLTISNGGKLFGGAMIVGGFARDVSNAYNVGGLGVVSTVSNGAITVGQNGAAFNTMTITNANLLSGTATIGSGSSNNTVTVQANAYWNLLGASAIAGSGAATGNVLFVAGGGILEAGGLVTGTGARNSISNFGGVYQFNTNTPTITVGANSGGIAINSGTISFRAITNADVTSSQGNGALKNISFSGANTFMLNSASNNITGQTYTFGVVSGNPSNYVNLVMLNGATAYRGGDLTLGTTGTMLVSNTTASIGGNFTNSGVVTILNSPITFASNFINQGTVQLGSNSTVTGLLTMNNGTLMSAGGLAQTYTTNINLQAAGNFDTTAGNLTLAGVLTNVGSLVKAGTGVLTLTATNTYTGGTVVQNGSLIMGNALAVSNGTALTVNGGIFDPNGNAIVVGALNGSGGVISNYGLTVAGGGNYSGAIVGSGSLVNTGTVSTVLILSGNNTYSGATTISNGALQAASNSAISTGTVSVLTGGALQLNGGVTLGNTLTLFDTGVTNSGALRNISGNNSYTGVVTLGSAARINSDANQLTISNLNNNSFNLTVGGASTTLVASVISGSGGLVKDGTGVLTLNGTQAFTGATTISNGMLAVNGSLFGGGVVNVLSNGTLTGSAMLGSVTNNGGGTIAPGNNGVGTITAAALTLAVNSQLALDFSTGARSYDQIFVTNLNGLAVSGGVLSLYKANTNATFDQLGSYKLIKYNGTLNPTATNLLSVADATQNRLYGFSLSGGWVTLSITSTGGLGWVGGGVNDSWSTSANWAGGSVPQAGDQLIFDGHTGLNNTNNLTAHTQFSGIYFNTTADAFTLNGNAVDLINDVNNLSAHTQTINLPLVLAASGLSFNAASGNVVINGAISETNGSFGLTKDGAATLYLAGPNTYTGGTILDAGTLSVSAISDSGASGISTGGVLTFNGGTLQYTGAGAASTLRGITNIGIAYIDVTNSAAQLTLGGVISGGNGLMKSGAGTLVLAGTNTYSGGTTINNGTVAISADFNLGAAGGALILGGGTLEAITNLALDSTRNLTLNSPGGTFNVDTNSTLTVGNTIGGAGALTKSGAGTLVLSNGANNYLGGTVINAGILALRSDGATNENAGALGTGLVTITGNSQLRLGGGENLSYSIGNGLALSKGTIYAVAGVQNLTGSLTVNSGGGTLSAQAGTNDLFLTGVVSGSGALTVYDTGTTSSGRGLVRFANNGNTYNGTLNISSNGNNGVVSVDATNALQFTTVNDVSGYGNSLVFYQATASATNFTLGALSGTANIILQTWTNTAGGDPLVTGPALTLLVGGNNSNTTYAGALGGSGALVKTGTGMMTLFGANTNSGGVTVSSGTILLSGGDNRLLTNGAVTVAGGTLNLGGFTQSNGNTFAILSGILTNGTVAKSGADYLGQSGTISATLAGSAGFTKSTTGTLSLTGAQSYTGATTLSNGTLVVNGSLYNAGLVNVLSNATLTGTATLGNVTVGTGGILTPGNNGIGTFAMGTLTTANGSLFNFDFAATTNDQLLVTANNGLTVTGGVFTLYQAGTTQTFDALGTYNLIDYVGAIGGLGVTNFAVANTIGNRSYTFGTNNGWVTLTIAGLGVGWLGANSALWSDPGNWVGNQVPTNGIAVFNGNTQTATINDLADHAILAGITFDTQASAFSLSGNSINLEGDVLNLSPNPQTITLPLVLEGSGGTRTFNASNGTLIVNGVISETNGVFTLVKTGTNLWSWRGRIPTAAARF